MNGNGVKAYKQADVTTADAKKLVILCYEAVIGNLKMAQESFNRHDYENKAKCLQKSQDIICELMNALDFDSGGEIARNLYALYNYFNTHIMESDLKKDMAALSEDIRMLEDLKEAWQEIFYGPSQSLLFHSAAVDGDRVRMTASYRV